jgi:CRISPR-associated protein Cas2
MSQYIASYDISDDRRRQRVARVLLGYGFRVQRSVYQVYVEPEELEDLQFEVAIHLEASDEFVLYPVDERGTRTTISWQRTVEALPAVLIL